MTERLKKWIKVSQSFTGLQKKATKQFVPMEFWRF